MGPGNLQSPLLVMGGGNSMDDKKYLSCSEISRANYHRLVGMRDESSDEGEIDTVGEAQPKRW